MSKENKKTDIVSVRVSQGFGGDDVIKLYPAEKYIEICSIRDKKQAQAILLGLIVF